MTTQTNTESHTKKQKQILLDLGQNIKNARTKYGLSQGNLSLKAGLQYNYVGILERGLRNPTFLVLRKIAKALEISVGELVEEVDMDLEDEEVKMPFER